jgi:hypothetical protein
VVLISSVVGWQEGHSVGRGVQWYCSTVLCRWWQIGGKWRAVHMVLVINNAAGGQAGGAVASCVLILSRAGKLMPKHSVYHQINHWVPAAGDAGAAWGNGRWM